MLDKLMQKDGLLTINKRRRLRKRQSALLKQLSGPAQSEYLLSLLGLMPKASVETIKDLRYRRNRRQGIDILKQRQQLYGHCDGYFMQKFRELCNTYASHSPSQKDVGQWLGVEIECFIPITALENNFEAKYCGCDEDEDGNPSGTCCNMREAYQAAAFNVLSTAFKNAKIKRANIKEDGSLSADDSEGVPIEITLLLAPFDGFKELQKACQILSSFGCYVNASCGLHVHLDARHLSKLQAAKIGKRLGHALPVLAQMVPKSRHTNHYCKLGVSDINSDVRESRYAAINLYSYKEHSTIEIRLHSGTTCAKKISNWIIILRSVVASDLRMDLTDLQSFIDKVSVPDKVLEYMDRRISKFSDGSNEDAFSANIGALEVNTVPTFEAPTNVGQVGGGLRINLNDTYMSYYSTNRVASVALTNGTQTVEPAASTITTLEAQKNLCERYIQRIQAYIDTINASSFLVESFGGGWNYFLLEFEAAQAHFRLDSFDSAIIKYENLCDMALIGRETYERAS